jgi:hypothetical protein
MRVFVAIVAVAILLLAVAAAPMVLCAIVTLLAPAALIVPRRAFIARAAQTLALFAVASFRGPPALV